MYNLQYAQHHKTANVIVLKLPYNSTIQINWLLLSQCPVQVKLKIKLYLLNKKSNTINSGTGT